MKVLLRAWPNEEGEIEGGFEIIVQRAGLPLSSGDLYYINCLPTSILIHHRQDPPDPRADVEYRFELSQEEMAIIALLWKPIESSCSTCPAKYAQPRN